MTLRHLLLSVVTVLAAMTSLACLALGGSDKSVDLLLPGIHFTRSLNGAAERTRVDGDKIVLTSAAKTDNFRDPGGKEASNTAPLLLSKVDNTRPFTLTTRITPGFLQTYDAGALYIWVKDDLWLKMAMEQDERKRVRMVTVRTSGTSDDNNHDVVSAKTVHMKISSDTHTVGFYYSVDGTSWQLIRLFRNEYPAVIWLGISAQSPVGNGTQALFENVELKRESIVDFRLGQ